MSKRQELNVTTYHPKQMIVKGQRSECGRAFLHRSSEHDHPYGNEQAVSPDGKKRANKTKTKNTPNQGGKAWLALEAALEQLAGSYE
jgi:hypothetical protein